VEIGRVGAELPQARVVESVCPQAHAMDRTHEVRSWAGPLSFSVRNRGIESILVRVVGIEC